MEPRIQYAKTSDGVSIAFAAVGQGPPLVYLVGPPFSHVQQVWRIPGYAWWNERLAATRKLVLLDSRGSGLSERDVAAFSLDDLCLDVDAVADRLALDSFALIGSQAGGLIAIRYALTRPQRVSLLGLFEAYPSGKDFLNIPQLRAFAAMMETDWELYTEALAHYVYGWTIGEPARRLAAFLRECATAPDARKLFEAVSESDLSHHLSEIAQPTLVIQHRGIPFPDMETAKGLAARIPNAQLVVLDGTWLEPGDDIDVMIRALDELQGMAASPAATGQPAAGAFRTILITDVEGSTALTQRLGDARAREVLREHERIVREALAAHGGSEVKTMGDGFMASFGSATKALACAVAIQRAIAEWSASLPARPEPVEGRAGEIRVRIGLNAGEPIAEEAGHGGEDLFGTAVIMAERICGKAQGGEIIASNVVRELAAGKGFLFSDRGETALKGFEDPVRLYEVRWREED